MFKLLKLQLRLQFFTCDGNALSRNYSIAVARTSFCVWHVLRRNAEKLEKD